MLENIHTKNENGELRALRAMKWCTSELLKYGNSYPDRDNTSRLLLNNVRHIFHRLEGTTTDSFSNEILEGTNFTNHENLHNFLMAEQIWLENNRTEVVHYVTNLLQAGYPNGYSKERQTSEGLRQVIYQIIKGLDISQRKQLSVFDPACGLGFLLLGLQNLLPETNLRLAGQDINQNLKDSAELLFKATEQKIDLRYADLLHEDAFNEEKFDIVLLDAPLLLQWRNSQEVEKDPRFIFGLPSNSDANLLFIQASLSKLKPPEEGGGVLIAVTTNKNLIAERENKKILESFYELDLVQAVISLPGGIGQSTNLPLYLLVMSNKKPSHWNKKVQLVNVKSHFDDVIAANGRKRLLSSDGLSQVRMAVSKPKPLKTARILTLDELWLYKSDVIYPGVRARIWNSDSIQRIAKFSQTNLTEDPSMEFVGTNSTEGLNSIEINNSVRYLSYQVEPRFKSIVKKVLPLHNDEDKTVALIRLTDEITALSKKEASQFDFSQTEYLAIPRNGSDRCFHVHRGDVPEDVNKYMFLSLIQNERIPYLVAWLNSSHGTRAQYEIWQQLEDESRFITGMYKPSEIVKFFACLQVPFLNSKQLSQKTHSVTQLDQMLKALKGLEDEIWTDETAFEIIEELSKSINSEASLARWADDLPFPLAASLRTYESFRLDSAKASDQLIHFWEATTTFMATYLFSALKKSDELWSSEVPKLLKAIEAGHCSLDRATIGTWRIIFEYLSKRFKDWLQSDDYDEQNRAIKLLGGSSRRNYEKLLNPQVLTLFGQVNEFRNIYDGHSGTMSEAQERSKHDELLALTHELKSVIGNAWNGLRLIRPLNQSNMRDGIELECEILIGPTTPFVNQRIRVYDNLIRGELYLVGEDDSVQLIPFVRMGAQPNEIEDTCYFYNRKDSDGARYVSYHKSIQNEITEKSESLLKTLDEIQNLSMPSIEDLFLGED
jgi:hypothetical protein